MGGAEEQWEWEGPSGSGRGRGAVGVGGAEEQWEWEGPRSSGSGRGRGAVGVHYVLHVAGVACVEGSSLGEQPSLFAVTSEEGFTWRSHANCTASVVTVTLCVPASVWGAWVLCWRVRGGGLNIL